ncbi:transcriptional regulator, TetR family [Chitinophaga sp. CF118]|uniref:TetR/AcrR family transcriptional regulator n=1 Tax=Chitinophaga sp. CF118 TaxID=1884367 RepID=UPI0008E7C901|nr:TetR/AcrR family transcriptional regulator [Chitinophaga sp. CF118]SFD89837.1 transcriptional regulator, TetR family [Chitinophaga sp. CF118]
MKESKEHILITSLKLFLQKSFKDVTMKDIVEGAGMSKGAIYHYFNSKEQVFEEVVEHFFINMMMTDLNAIPLHSLKQFYTDLISDMEEKRKKRGKLIHENKDDPFNVNYYYLIFDAMKILPDFKEKLFAHQKEEIKVWTYRIKHAREAGEIKSAMTDAQLAKLFIYSGDGVGISMIMEETSNKMKAEIKTLWDGLYNSIKA